MHTRSRARRCPPGQFNERPRGPVPGCMQGDDPAAIRELLIDDVRWRIRAEEQDPSAGGTLHATITYVWFVSGRESRVAYADRPAAEILERSDAEVRALFRTAVPAIAG
jgi:hypothetical protein